MLQTPASTLLGSTHVVEKQKVLSRLLCVCRYSPSGGILHHFGRLLLCSFSALMLICKEKNASVQFYAKRSPLFYFHWIWFQRHKNWEMIRVFKSSFLTYN